MQDEAELYHTELVEKICELDDDLMMEYLEGEEPSIDAMKAVLRKATCECTAVPVCCGTAYRNKGVQQTPRCNHRVYAGSNRHPGNRGC